MGGRMRILPTISLSLALLAAPGAVSAETWAIQFVDVGSSSGASTSLGLLDGFPVISYFGAPHSLKYASLNPQTKVFDLLRVDAGGEFTSLAVDPAGIVSVGYLDAVALQLKYWRLNAGQGFIQTVDSGTGQGGLSYYDSIKLDAQGRPQISYYDWRAPDGTTSQSKLKYAVLNGTSWSTEFVDPVSGRGRYNSLALDASGNPQIAYRDDIDGQLRLAKKAGTWTTQVVDSSLNSPGWFPSISLNGLGQPRISYIAGTTGQLRYAAFDGVLWHFENVDGVGTLTSFSATSLALDSGGNPHIAYYDASAGSLKYASRSGPVIGGTWTVQTVDSVGDVGGYSSLILDATGRPIISYFDATTQALKIAYGNYPDQDSDGIPDVFDNCVSNPDCNGNGIVDGREGAPKQTRLSDEPIFGCGTLAAVHGGGPPGGPPPPFDLLFLLAPAAYLLLRSRPRRI